ncbi:MAG: enoyl-CoA hydratase/isomerase family protein [Gemmatimonadetes bacterium]|nr:enoyl-CoA hydratase/isomerase family protein [Gemmatimonadota bacterium]
MSDLEEAPEAPSREEKQAAPLGEGDAAPTAADHSTLDVALDGVAWLTIPSPGGVARLPRTVVHALGRRLSEVESAIEAGQLRALIVHLPTTSGGTEDLQALLGISKESDGTAEAVAGQTSLRRLEQLAVPTIAAIEGACAGAELELALACSYRVATESVETRFLLHQLRLGLLPALGGTVRLPRLIGIDAALRLIVHGVELDAAAARTLGLVDVAVAAGELEARARQFALERVERGRIRTGARRRVHRRLIEDTAPGRRILFARASRLAAEALAPPTAVRAALDSVADGIALPLERAFEREAELYGQLVVTETAKSLIHAALLDGRATHSHPPDGAVIERVAVLGSGREAVEIASLFARRGFPVRLKDRDRTAVAKSVQLLRERLSDSDTRAGAPDGPRAREERVEGTTGFGGFGVIEMVVAAPEGRPEKVLQALTESEEHVGDTCTLASSSPLLPLAELTQAVRLPARALGLVASRPPEIFPLIEIVSGEASDANAVAAACRLASSLGGTPLHVADGPGFLAHRLLAVLLVEATRLVHEGARVESVDSEMEGFGLLMGPLQRIDAIGVGGVIQMLSALSPRLGARLSPTPVMLWMADRDARFYRYRRGRPLGVNPGLPRREGVVPEADGERLRDRLLLALVNESARILEEGIVATAADVDVGAIFGLGYPRRRGGLLFQADRAGLSATVQRLESLAIPHGETFRPAALLTRLAAAGEGFYPARPLTSGQAPG